jgi:hypothetical protein
LSVNFYSAFLELNVKDFKAYLIINFQTDNIGDSSLKIINYQDLLDLVDDATIFSAGGEGDFEVGYMSQHGLLLQLALIQFSLT